MLRHLVMTVRFTEVIYRIGSDLPYMGRGILRRDTIYGFAADWSYTKRWHRRSQAEYGGTMYRLCT